MPDYSGKCQLMPVAWTLLIIAGIFPTLHDHEGIPQSRAMTNSSGQEIETDGLMSDGNHTEKQLVSTALSCALN